MFVWNSSSLYSQVPASALMTQLLTFLRLLLVMQRVRDNTTQLLICMRKIAFLVELGDAHNVAGQARHVLFSRLGLEIDI